MSGRMLNFHLPLTPGGEREAHLTLPNHLTAAESERIAAFVAALAMPTETNPRPTVPATEQEG